MFVHRNVYEAEIGDYLFKANDTKGLVEVFNENNQMIGFIRKAPESYDQFLMIAHKMYNDMENR